MRHVMLSAATVAVEQCDFFLTQRSVKVRLLELVERCVLQLLNETASHESKYAL